MIPAPERSNRLALLLAILTAGAAIFPLYWAFISALRPSEDIFKYLSPLSPWTFFPNRMTSANLITVLSGSFGRAMLNSIGVGIATVVLGLLICTPAAFALAKLNLPGRGLIFSVVILSFLIPFDAIAIPLSALFRDSGLENSYLGIILPGIGNGFAVFLLRQFFLGIPSEIADAARVDGLTKLVRDILENLPAPFPAGIDFCRPNFVRLSVAGISLAAPHRSRP
jgi:multiple sugar transport system permease protein